LKFYIDYTLESICPKPYRDKIALLNQVNDQPKF
jgi:hypothetical protein